jgi:hypothetical protein
MPPVKKEPETTPIPAPAEITPEELAALRARIEAYEAAEKQRETGAFTGVARCVNQACEKFDVSMPIALQLEVKEMRSEDTPALVLSTSEYLHPVDDADLPCPKCKVGRAIMAQEPPTYAAMAPR